MTEDLVAIAQTYYDQYLAFLEVGFTEEQATLLLSRPQVTVTPGFPPELHEFWERQNALALKVMKELDDN